MRIGDATYFAPDLPFRHLDLTGRELPGQILARLEGYYLQPADLCIQHGHAFAAGLLAVTCVDAAAKFAHGPNRERRITSKDFMAFARSRLPSFKDVRAAKTLYDDYRNGLVHEARLKNGCQFALGVGRAFDASGVSAVIDAEILLQEIRSAVHSLVNEMYNSEAFQQELVTYVRQTFEAEIALSA